jgi:hypothetical protein
MEIIKVLSIGNLSIDYFSDLGIVVCRLKSANSEDEIDFIDLSYKSQFFDLEEVEVIQYDKFNLN